MECNTEYTPAYQLRDDIKKCQHIIAKVCSINLSNLLFEDPRYWISENNDYNPLIKKIPFKHREEIISNLETIRINKIILEKRNLPYKLQKFEYKKIPHSQTPQNDDEFENDFWDLENFWQM